MDECKPLAGGGGGGFDLLSSTPLNQPAAAQPPSPPAASHPLGDPLGAMSQPVVRTQTAPSMFGRARQQTEKKKD
jgi:hypothetical protein